MDTTDITPTKVELIDPKRQRLAVLAEDTRTRMKRSALDIYHIGANLLEAQNLLAHGEFLLWIEAEFGMGKSSAYKFINVAKAFQGKFPQNGNLEIAASALYLLASPDTPEDARIEALRLAAAGEPISPKKARKIVEKHTSIESETTALGKALGLPTRGNSTLPESDRIDDLTHTSPADVDDRPGVTPLPTARQPKSGWDISPQSLSTTFKGHKIGVHFEDRGNEYFFGFRGPENSISASGFHSESISDRARVKREYLNPGVWADFKAEKLYADYQKSLAESTRTDEHITATVDLNDADAATSKECIVVSASATPTSKPWAVVAEFSITVGLGSVVQVKFFPEELVHRFDFRGAVSETGYYCSFIPAQIAQRYRSPKECATALADDLHAQWMKAKPKPYKHGIAAGDTVRVLLGRGKHEDKITEATSVTAKEILTPLGTFKANAVVKYVDYSAEMKALGIVPKAPVEIKAENLKAEVACTFADGRVLVNGRYYHFSQVTVLEPATVAQPTENSESAEVEKGAIATSVESMLPEILASESEPDYEKQAPAELSEVGSTADMDTLIDFHGTTVVARMYAQASPDLQQTIKDFYPGIGAIVTSELGGSEFNKIADRAGFLPNHEPDAVQVEMLLQENARLDEALRLCEEHVERLERENRKLYRKLESQQTELDRINKENTDLQERIRNLKLSQRSITS